MRKVTRTKRRINAGCYKDGVGSLGWRLNKLGYSNYSSYLSSDHWQNIRHLLILERGKTCQICLTIGSKLNAHHRTYERFGNELLSDLILICDDCHRRIHQSERMGCKGGLEMSLNRVFNYNEKRKADAIRAW
jgi:5-methylcytosine-specific restriction endonuclease McrA